MRILPPTILPLRAAAVALLGLAGAVAAGEETALPAAAPPGAADASPAAAGEREAAYAGFRKAFDDGDYPTAAAHARRVVELTEQAPAAGAEELQVALMNHALAQQLAGDPVGAEASYLRVIELIESAGRHASPRLARACAGLATTLHGAGRHEAAAAAFERAIALNRRTEGLFNAEQLPLLEKQADSLTELGRAEQALLAHRYALQVVARRDGQRSVPYARALESLGRWYTRVRSFEAGRATLQRAAALVESLENDDSLAMVGPLTGIAENARRWLLDPQIRATSPVDEDRRAMFHDTMMPTPPGLSASTIGTEGLKALERAAAIVDADGTATPLLVARVHAQLGDWHQARQAPDRARPHYLRAWQAAGGDADGMAIRKALFGDPVLIRYVLPDNWDRYARRPPEEIERRDVAIELTVTADGGIRDPRPVGGASDDKLVAQALRALETACYRPRIVDGEPVDAGGVRFVQPFYVLREDEPAPAATDSPPAAQGRG